MRNREREAFSHQENPHREKKNPNNNKTEKKKERNKTVRLSCSFCGVRELQKLLHRLNRSKPRICGKNACTRTRTFIIITSRGTILSTLEQKITVTRKNVLGKVV